MTLAEFLFARIADDEQVARSRARDGGYRSGRAGGAQCPPSFVRADSPIGGGRDDSAQEARDDRPALAGALASCEAKRRIVADFGGPDAGGVDKWTAEAVLRALALSYSDHPDFDPFWRTSRTQLE